MSQPIRTLGALALGASIVAIAALSVRTGPVAGAADDPPAKTITVSATGKVTVVPDVARVYLGVTVGKPTVKAAREAGAKAMTDILAALKGLGIADADIQTTGLNLSPQYGSGSRPNVVGYQISEQIEVTVRDLDKAGDVVDTAMGRGATDMNGISFEVSDPVKAQNDARAAAVDAARTSAQVLAKAGNVSLGAVVSITDGSAPIPPRPYAYGGRDALRGRQGHADPARDAGPGCDRHGGVRDRLTRGRNPAAADAAARSGARRDATLARCDRPPRPSRHPWSRPRRGPRSRPTSGSGWPLRSARRSSTAPPTRRRRSRSAPSRRSPWPACRARWRSSSSSGWCSAGVLPRTSPASMTRPRLIRLVTLAALGGLLFIAGTNVAVAISGPTITGFVAPLYAVFATLFAVPILGERIRPSTVVAFGLAFVGTAFLAGTVPTGTPAAGVILALIAAATFGLYVVLARRWGRPYHLDGTLITIANLVGRGPILLVAAMVADPGTVVPANPDPGGRARPADARGRVEHVGQSPADGLGATGERRADVGRAAADPRRLGRHRCRASSATGSRPAGCSGRRSSSWRWPWPAGCPVWFEGGRPRPPPDGRAYGPDFASLISRRWPSGSRKKARTSQADSTGSVRNGGAARAEPLVLGPAVRHADGHRVADDVGVGRVRRT